MPAETQEIHKTTFTTRRIRGVVVLPFAIRTQLNTSVRQRGEYTFRCRKQNKTENMEGAQAQEATLSGTKHKPNKKN